MFLDFTSKVSVAPPISHIKIWLKNPTFTFLTSNLKVSDGLKHIVTVTFQVLCTKNTFYVTDTDQKFCK